MLGDRLAARHGGSRGLCRTCCAPRCNNNLVQQLGATTWCKNLGQQLGATTWCNNWVQRSRARCRACTRQPGPGSRVRLARAWCRAASCMVLVQGSLLLHPAPISRLRLLYKLVACAVCRVNLGHKCRVPGPAYSANASRHASLRAARGVRERRESWAGPGAAAARAVRPHWARCGQ
jgi:hypothetical protein